MRVDCNAVFPRHNYPRNFFDSFQQAHLGMIRLMEFAFPKYNQCLTHQLPEVQAGPVGLVCSRCRQHLQVAPPRGRCSAYWESQPAAYSLDGEPCFVYVLAWDNYRIRSLHPPHSHADPRGQRARQTELDRSGIERDTAEDDGEE